MMYILSFDSGQIHHTEHIDLAFKVGEAKAAIAISMLLSRHYDSWNFELQSMVVKDRNVYYWRSNGHVI